MNNSFKIYDIIENFYCKIKEENLVNNDLMINLKYAVQNVLVFETNA